jgi:formate hydrogenlyase subunit 3/multisubunit Na+/H+ antiporter MnhD subunit
VLLLIIVFSALRAYSAYSSQLNSLYSKASFLFVSVTLFYFLSTLVALNYLLDQYSEISYVQDESLNISLFSVSYSRLLSLSTLSCLNFEVYLYPFIYVFLLITVLSIVFCLTYNQDELYSFMFYCTLILMSGYALFFTDSMIIFFFAYEMLLVPSFFILYKFAKTRRCVEAAYLMFF